MISIEACLRFGRGLALAGLLAGVLAGCETIDPIDSRLEVVNRSISNYNSVSTLLNILRAKDREPLNFFAVTQFQGHNTISQGVGLPPITLGPRQTALERQAIFGPNPFSRVASNDFTIIPVDDPGSYTALLTPINPITLSYFITEGYPRELLYNLFIDQIIVRDTRTGAVTTYDNDPDSSSSDARQFDTVLSELMRYGLTFQTRAMVGDLRSQKTFRVCFAHKTAGATGDVAHRQDTDIGMVIGSARCDQTAWVEPEGFAKPASDKPAPAGWTLMLGDRQIELSTRSAYGVYEYLGRYVELKSQKKLSTTVDADLFLLQTGDIRNCYVKAAYDQLTWCVPTSARNTKLVFSILRQLVQLYTTPTDKGGGTISARLTQ